jgi:hypothetical protein
MNVAKVINFFLMALAALSYAATQTGCTNQNRPERTELVSKFEVAPRTDDRPETRAAYAASSKFSIIKSKYFKKDISEGTRAPHATFSATKSPVLSSTVTFARKAILDRVFLFGSDLQYSSIGEDDGMLLQSMALGHATARFQILGDKLQLVAEEKYRFQSDINIPLRLLHEWPIVASSPDAVTVKIESASLALGGLFGSENPARTTWIRSVEYISDGDYLLIESSVELADGKVAEFMESLFPRETLVKNAPSPIFDDPSLEPLAKRFGFLSDSVWMTIAGNGRMKTAVANRFARPAAGTTIDWYVTPNIPSEYIPAVRDGIEGWNRYAQKMWGRDLLRFKGLLPIGVKIGDPRYNVVNWDSVTDASSAYESQAADPETGIQSHSLIYLPYAWVKIGEEFWNTSELTQDKSQALKQALDQIHFLGRKIEARCFNEGANAVHPELLNDPSQFAKELLKGVLFHEVGHALGLAHNFKGSLEWDPDVPGSLFSSSIMEYNQYQIEGGAFHNHSTETQSGAAGPLLEYDRQILSVLYNEAKDLSPSDRILPHCDDSAADSLAGGVDPFCLRYDAGKDPSQTLVRTLDLIQDPSAKLGNTKSLAAAIELLQSSFPDPTEIVTEQDLLQVEAQYQTKILATAQYYLSAGAQGLNYMMLQNLRALQVFRGGAEPEGVSSIDVRIRVADTMDKLMKMERFSTATLKEVDRIGDQHMQWLRATAWYKAAAANVRQARETSFGTTGARALKALESSLLPRIRSRQLGSLRANPNAPFYLAPQADYELKALEWLSSALVGTLPSGLSYSIGERVAAAQSLATFALNPEAAILREKAKEKVRLEIAASKSAEEREALRGLFSALR